MNLTVERALGASIAVRRCLVPLDVLLTPTGELCWIKRWHASGGLVGAVLGVIRLQYGGKCLSRPVFGFEAYRRLVATLAQFAIATWVVMAVFKLVWFVLG